MIGISLLVIPGLSQLVAPRSATPGKLVPRQSVITWQGPEEPKSTQSGALSMDEAFATFELENVGGSPVRILDVQTSCGCAQPKIQPATIQPGALGIVEVRALPIQVGEKLAIVTLRTDSPLTPEVVLRLRRIGNRRPPFLLQAAGELTWAAGFSKAETRPLVVTQIELQGSEIQPPIIQCSLPFLEVGAAARLDEEPYIKPGVVARRYHYEVKFSSDPPRGVFSGEVLVIDPWDPQRIESRIVHGESLPPLRVTPARAVLRIGNVSDIKGIRADFLVLSADPVAELVLEAEGGPDSPLVISPLQWIEVGRRAHFSVGVAPGRVREGRFDLQVRGSSDSSERVVVPIAVRVESTP